MDTLTLKELLYHFQIAIAGAIAAIIIGFIIKQVYDFLSARATFGGLSVRIVITTPTGEVPAKIISPIGFFRIKVRVPNGYQYVATRGWAKYNWTILDEYSASRASAQEMKRGIIIANEILEASKRAEKLIDQDSKKRKERGGGE
jgi:hypothetical protein